MASVASASPTSPAQSKVQVRETKGEQRKDIGIKKPIGAQPRSRPENGAARSTPPSRSSLRWTRTRGALIMTVEDGRRGQCSSSSSTSAAPSAAETKAEIAAGNAPPLTFEKFAELNPVVAKRYLNQLEEVTSKWSRLSLDTGW